MAGKDIRITPAIRAYLAAFDHWSKNQHDGATDLKDACFDAMRADANTRHTMEMGQWTAPSRFSRSTKTPG